MQGQTENTARTNRNVGIEIDLSTRSLDDQFCDRKSEACAAMKCGLRPGTRIEAAKDCLPFGTLYARPLVAYAEFYVLAIGLHNGVGNRDGGVGFREFDGIVHDIHDGPTDETAVAGHCEAPCILNVCDEPDLFFIRQDLQNFKYLVRRFNERECIWSYGFRRLRLRKHQETTYGLVQPISFFQNAGNRFLVALGATFLTQRYLTDSPDRSHWSSKFMGSISGKAVKLTESFFQTIQ